MAESSALTAIDVMLRVWAIAGPLIVGGVSAWWSRKNTIEDRGHEEKRLAEDRAHHLEMKREDIKDASINKKIERRKEYLQERHAALQDAAVKLLASSHEFTRKQSLLLGAYGFPQSYLNRQQVIDKATEAAAKAMDEMTHYSQMVILHGDADLSNMATEFWNSCLKVPADTKGMEADGYQDTLARYRNSRLALQSRIKEHLNEYEKEISHL